MRPGFTMKYLTDIHRDTCIFLPQPPESRDFEHAMSGLERGWRPEAGDDVNFHCFRLWCGPSGVWRHKEVFVGSRHRSSRQGGGARLACITAPQGALTREPSENSLSPFCRQCLSRLPLGSLSLFFLKMYLFIVYI